MANREELAIIRNARAGQVAAQLALGKLYQTYQTWADAGTELEIRALNVGVGYWFAVEAFNENGVSGLSDAVHIE